MRIAYVCLQPRTGHGASDTHVDGIVGALRDRGHQVDLVELRRGSAHLLTRTLAALALHLRHLRTLRRAEVVYLRMHPLGVLTVLAVRPRPVVIEVNGTPEDFVQVHQALRPLRALLSWLLQRQLRWARHVFCVTRGLAQQVLETAPGTPTSVLPNAADPNVFRPDLAPPTGLPERYALYFGSLSPWQGVNLMVEAIEHEYWPPNLPLVIIGDGAHRNRVVEAAARSAGRMRWLGAMPVRSLPPYIANASLTLALKQYHDPAAGQSPLKLYESAACGTPVLTTALPGSSDALTVGAIPVAADAASVAATVASLVNRPDELEKLAVLSRQEILDGHTWQHRAALVEEVLRRLSRSHLGQARS